MIRCIAALLLTAVTAYSAVDLQVLNKKADAGDAQAQYELGTCYRKGDGVEKNLETAVKWLRRSAEQDHGPAVVSMVYRYEKGEGVKQDLDEATRWYEKALELGYTRDLKRQQEALVDYAAKFSSLDENLRTRISDTRPAEYLQWMEEAIECKERLKRTEEIDPWLEGLSITFSNSWKILHAVAFGYQDAADSGPYELPNLEGRLGISIDEVEYNRWRGLKLMDRAWRLAKQDQVPDGKLEALIRDYLIILMEERADNIELLTEKTIDLPEKVASVYRYGDSSRAEPLFFDRPDSYDAAKNDAEIALWLLGRCDITIDDEFTISKEAQLVLAKAAYIETLSLGPYGAEENWTTLHNLADDEMVVWRDGKPQIRSLPDHYHFIAELEQLANEEPFIPSMMLATIFKQRCQLARAAKYYDLAGETNEVRSITAPQGTFEPCPAQPYGNVSVNYAYRNGSEVEIALYRINAGSNLLQRLEAGTVMESEMNLLRGDPDGFRKHVGFDQTNALEHVDTFIVDLDPLSDHRDSEKEIVFKDLKGGNYLVRARMKGGNKAETVLNVYDSMLYSTALPSPCLTNAHTLFMLCDARTGKPRPNEEIHLYTLSGGGTYKRTTRERADGAYTNEWHVKGVTDKNGCYLFEERFLGNAPSSDDDLFGGEAKFLYIVHAPEPAHPLVVFSSKYHRGIIFPLSDVQDPFITTDRPIYRPGDAGHLLTWQGPETNSLKLEISNHRAFKLPFANTNNLFPPDGFGSSQADFSIPADAPLGSYSIRQIFEEDNERTWSHLRVEEYRTPEFEVSIRQMKDGNIEIRAVYAYGQPVASGELTGTIEFLKADLPPWYPARPFDGLWEKGYWWNGDQFDDDDNDDDQHYDYERRQLLDYDFSRTLDADGRAIIDLKEIENGTEALGAPGRFSIRASVTDAAHKEYSTREHFENNLKQIRLCCWTDKAFYNASDNLIVETASGDAESGLQIRLSRIKGADCVEHSTHELRVSSMTLASPGPGLYQVEVLNAASEASAPFRFFMQGDSVSGLTADNPIRLVSEKGAYNAEETATLLLQTDQPGRYVWLFDRITGHNGSTMPRIIYMDQSSKRIKLPLNGEAGLLQSAAMTVVDGKLHSTTCKTISTEDSKKTGAVQILTDRPVYAPRDTVKAQLQVVDQQNEGMPCAVAVSVYNRMLDSFGPSLPGNIYRALFSSWQYHPGTKLKIRQHWPHAIFFEAPDWVMEKVLYGNVIVKSEAVFSAKSVGGDLFGSAPAQAGAFDGFGAGLASSDSLLEFSISAMEQGGVGDKPVLVREDFADAAYWNGFIETDENGEASLEFPVPDSMTDWKIVAWAMHTNFAASGETTFKCAKDFVVQLNTPRAMVEGDELGISASLRNHTTNTLNAAVVFSSDTDSKEQKINLKADEEGILYWQIRAESEGTEQITVVAKSTDASDGMTRPIPILPHGMLKRGGNSGILAGSRNETTVDINIPKAVDPESIRLHLNCTPNMLESVGAALPWLADYPYGCTEQTLNRFLPSLIVLETLDQLSITLTDFNLQMPRGRSAVFVRDGVIERAQAGIRKLEEAQHWRGQWSWNLESDSSYTDPLVTALATRGLYRASMQKSLTVNRGVIVKAVNKIAGRLVNQMNPPWRRRGNLQLSNTDALMAVVLNEINLEECIPDKGDLDIARYVSAEITDFLMKHTDELSLYGKILLAYAFELQGNARERDRLMEYIEQYLEHNPKLDTYWLRSSAKRWWYWYNDDIETMAWYLKLLNRMDPKGTKTAGVAYWLLINRKHGDHWKSTRDTALCVEALCEYIQNNGGASGKRTVQIMLNGRIVQPGQVEGLAAGENTLTLKSGRDAPLFFDAAWQYYTEADPIAPEQCDLLSISRSYYRVDSVTGKRGDRPLTANDKLNVGETIEVQLTIEAPQRMQYLLAQDFKPAGYECLDTESGYHSENSLYYYREIRNERILFYLNGLPKGDSKLTYRLRAELTGTVSALPAIAELMYAPDSAANSVEHKLKTVR